MIKKDLEIHAEICRSKQCHNPSY